MEEKIVEIYCCVDDFCKGYERWWNQHVLTNGCTKKRQRKSRLSLGEMVTIMVWFHEAHFWCFKHFYLYLLQHHRKEFPGLVSYDHFVRIIPRLLPVLAALIGAMKGTVTGIQFVDATSLQVCHPKRASGHKVFTSLASWGKTTTGWFFGLKMHTIINNLGEIVAVTFSTGSTSDQKPLPKLATGITGKLFGDKGYISQKLSDLLHQQGIQLITRIRKDMKNKLMPIEDKILLCRRMLIETVFQLLKAKGTFEHTRHRSPLNAFAHYLAALINFQFRPLKPAILSLFPLP